MATNNVTINFNVVPKTNSWPRFCCICKGKLSWANEFPSCGECYRKVQTADASGGVGSAAGSAGGIVARPSATPAAAPAAAPAAVPAAAPAVAPADVHDDVAMVACPGVDV